MKKTMRRGGKKWQLALMLLAGAFCAGTIASFVVASQSVSRVVDADYYDHGLHYNETHRDAAASLGWTLNVSLSGDRLHVVVRDPSGAPVPGGKVRYEPDGGTPLSPVVFSESAPGVYRSPPIQLRSANRGSIHFTKGRIDLYNKVVLFL